MGQKSGPVKEPAEQVVREIRRATRRRFSAEEKIRIVLSGLRGEDSIAELCRREGIVQNLYYRWSKEFLADRAPRAEQVWNRIPQAVLDSLIQPALDEPALSPRELAARFTDTRSYFISEAPVYRLLKAI